MARGQRTPSVINIADTVVISTGHNVVLDQNLQLTHTLSHLDVRGVLRTVSAQYVDLAGSPSLSVSGTLDIDSLVAVNITGTDITGQCIVKKFRCQVFEITGGGSITISERLHLLGPLTCGFGNTVAIANNAVVRMLGGMFNNTGTLTFGNPYDVEYAGAANTQPTGIELTGSFLRHITVNVANSTDELKLGADLDVKNGSLTLTNGILSLNNHNLRFSGTGDFSGMGGGSIKSASASDIEIAGTNALSGGLRFAAGGNTVNKLIINTAASAPKLGDDLKVTGTVDLQQGKLDVQSHKLSLITGATITGASLDKYIITGAGGSLATDIGSGASFTFPVGTADHYAPCIITSNNNTVYNGLSVGVNPGVKVFGTSGGNMAISQPMVDATWFVEHSNPTVDLDMELQWSSTMEVNSFDRNIAYIAHLLGNYWDTDQAKAAGSGANGLYSLKRSGIKSLSPFAIFDKNTVDVALVPSMPDIAIYPNPATNLVTIKLDKEESVGIVNASGQLVRQLRLSRGENLLDISSLQPGVYYLRFDGVAGYSRFVKH